MATPIYSIYSIYSLNSFRYDQETGGVLYTWGSGRGGALGFRSEEDIEDPTVVGDLQDMQVNGLK